MSVAYETKRQKLSFEEMIETFYKGFVSSQESFLSSSGKFEPFEEIVIYGEDSVFLDSVRSSLNQRMALEHRVGCYVDVKCELTKNPDINGRNAYLIDLDYYGKIINIPFQ
jgi:hypothetical protein